VVKVVCKLSVDRLWATHKRTVQHQADYLGRSKVAEQVGQKGALLSYEHAAAE